MVHPSIVPPDERERLAAVRRYDILDTPPDGAFDRVTAIAARRFGVPIAIVSIVDEDRIWFKSHHGVDVKEIGRDPGLCASATLKPEPHILLDAKADELDGSRSRRQSAKVWLLSKAPTSKGSHPPWSLQRSAWIWPKTFFQIHGVDAAGRVIVRKTLRRSQMLPFFSRLSPCLVGMEACGTSHYWARELIRVGHQVRLMPPAYVKPYVKRGKTDANDAEAICEAVTRPTMRFVAVKTAEQQAALSIHRARDLLVKQRTQLVNMIRGLLAEFGIDIPRGLERALLKARQIAGGGAPDVPAEAIKVVLTLSQQVLEIHVGVREMERDLQRLHRGNELSQRLATIPGIGPIGASTLVASVTDPQQFRSGRQFSAWLGLTPLQKSSGGKERLGRITKMGDKYLRKLLIVGMTSLVRRAKYKPETVDPRLAKWLAHKPVRVATVAMANKAARVVWAIMTRGDTCRAGLVPVLAAQ